MNRRVMLCLLLLAGVCGAARAEDMERKSVALTVYNQNFALVRDVRTMTLTEGLNTVRFSDIAAQIDATSVHFASLTAPDACTILEQNFEYDLVNADKLLRKYIDRNIRVLTKDGGAYDGFLASFDPAQLVLVGDREKGPVFMVNRENVKNIEFPRLPEGLITRPSLVWSLQNRKPGVHLAEVSYLTGGLTWRADYVATVAKEGKAISLNGWVTVDNNSGSEYPDAGLKLVAGDVHRVQEVPQAPNVRMAQMDMAVAGAAQFQEKPFFEYHLYTLQGKTTLKNSQTKQISLFTAPRVAVKKVYRYDGALYRWYYYDNWRQQQSNKKVTVNLEFQNSEQNGLGIPLPKGKVRVYQEDTDKTLQFVGEDEIDHTPADEQVAVLLGNAFDVVGERKISDHKMISTNLYRDSYEIVLRNHKSEPVRVKIVEHQWGDWKVIEQSSPSIKKDATTLEFEAAVPKDGSATVTYTAEYKF